MRFGSKATQQLCGWLLICFSLVCSDVSVADIVTFRLMGNAGDGLLPGNVTPDTGVSGHGGAGPSSITFNTATNILHIDVEWGSGNGYADLTGNVTLLHLHGPTPDPAPVSFGQTGPLLINLTTSLNFDPSFSSGGLVDNFFLSNSDIPGLMEGRLYINVHTDAFPMGEIRGYLVPIPEPGNVLAIMALVAAALTVRRNRQS